jgi:hypothetical protein
MNFYKKVSPRTAYIVTDTDKCDNKDRQLFFEAYEFNHSKGYYELRSPEKLSACTESFLDRIKKS